VRALLVKDFNRNNGECDLVVMFDDYKPIEVNLLYQEKHLGEGRLMVAVEGEDPVWIYLCPKE
jgi:hypothetical protein